MSHGEPSGSPETPRPETPSPGGGFRDPHLLTVIGLAFELALIPMAWLLTWLWDGPPIPPASWSASDAASAVLWTLPLVLFLAAITWTPLRELAPFRNVLDVFRKHYGEVFSRLEIWQIIALSIAAGVGEEVLFRGALQPRIGWIATSVLFGVIHWITPTYALFGAIVGAYLNWLSKRHDNLLVPILVHALYDIAALWALRATLRREGFPKESGSTGT